MFTNKINTYNQQITNKSPNFTRNKLDIFYKALELLKTPIEETWLFEDSLVALKTGKQIGFNTVGIYDKYNCEQDEIKKLSSIYISVNNTLATLLEDRSTNI